MLKSIKKVDKDYSSIRRAHLNFREKHQVNLKRVAFGLTLLAAIKRITRLLSLTKIQLCTRQSTEATGLISRSTTQEKNHDNDHKYGCSQFRITIMMIFVVCFCVNTKIVTIDLIPRKIDDILSSLV